MNTKEKVKILDAFLAEIRAISVNSLKQGVDAGDPLEQVRAACNVLEQAFGEYQAQKN